MRYQHLIDKFVRVISVVVYRNGRITKTEYFGILLEEKSNTITIKETDKKEINIQKRFVKRVEEHE